MSLCKNTIQKSDITSTPVKLKYSQAIVCGGELNIDFVKGKNENPFQPLGLISYESLVYREIRQLYYMNYISGSLLNSGSAWDSSLQSTAASGTYEYDHRYFPTESNSRIAVLKIPNEVFGEKISPETFNFSNEACTIIDDGNGNLLDYQNGNIHVGNIIYSQGVVILTNQDYVEVFPEKPKLQNIVAEFNYNDAKTINVLDNGDSGVGIFNTGSVRVFGTPDSQFFRVNANGTVTVITEKLGLFTTYYTAENIYNEYCGTISDPAKITVNINNLENCDFAGSIEQNNCVMTGSIRFNECDLFAYAIIIPPPTPSITPTISVTISVTRTPSPTRTPSRTPSVTPTTTPSITLSPSITLTPSITTSRTPSPTVSFSRSTTPTPSVSRQPSLPPGASQSPSPTISFSRTPTTTPSPSRPPSPPPPGESLTPAASITPPNSLTPSVSLSPPVSETPSLTPSITPSPQNNYVITNNTSSVLIGLNVLMTNGCVSASQAAPQNVFTLYNGTLTSGSSVSGSSPALPAQGACFQFSVQGSRITSVVINGTIYTTPNGVEGLSTFEVCDCTTPVNGNVSIIVNSYAYCVTYFNRISTPIQSPITYTDCNGISQTITYLAAGSTFCARYGLVGGQGAAYVSTNQVTCP